MSDLQERVERTARQFQLAARERGLFVTADNRVSEAAAADLVGYAPGSLKNLRSMGAGPAHFNRPLGGSRVSYRLDDLARWIERSREEAI